MGIGGEDPYRQEANDSWKTYYRKQSLLTFIPKDPYSHQSSLLQPYNLSVQEFGDLLNQHLLLGYVDDPVMLSFYQEEIYFITSIFAMSKQHPDMMLELFNMIYFPFVISIRMSVLMDGKERQFQAFAYKEGMKRRSLMDRIIGRKKQKMNIQDTIMPEEYWVMED